MSAKSLNTEARDSEAHYAARLMREIPVWLVSYGPGPDLRVRTVSAPFAAMMGPDDPVGLPLREVLPEVEGQQIYEIIEAAWTNQRTYERRGWRIQFDPADPDSEVVLDFTLMPTFDSDGNPDGVMGWAVDVTAREKAERDVQAAAAAAAERYQEAREVAALLQRALLPASLPVLPRLQLGGRYLVASDDQAAGGDWLEGLPLPDGRVALVVGDVVGHGAEASAAMGQLRTVLRTHFRRSSSLAQAVQGLEDHAADTPGARAATVAIVVCDPASGALEYVTCGHPAPLVVGSAGGARFLRDSGGRPLAADPDAATSIRTDDLAEGEILLLYTDGLVESPTRDLQTGARELMEAAGYAATHEPSGPEGRMPRPDLMCLRLVELMSRVEAYGDDVTVLAGTRRPAAVEPLVREVAPDFAGLDEVRDALELWLVPLEVTPRDRMAAITALVEAFTNAMEHSGGSAIEMQAALASDGRMTLSVHDDGEWRRSDSDGVGLMVIDRLMDDLQVAGEPSGTAVTMRRSLTHPLVQDETGRSSDGRVGKPFSMRVEEEADPCVLRLAGVVDTRAAKPLDKQLSRLTQGGVRLLVVDLSEVTMLASAGVRVLQQHSRNNRLEFEAPGDSPAGLVLELTGLAN